MHERRAGDDKARDEDHEDGGTVARIGEREVEPATLAARPHLQEMVEQRALAAAGTASAQAPRDALPKARRMVRRHVAL